VFVSTEDAAFGIALPDVQRAIEGKMNIGFSIITFWGTV
jgi:hypothetical protein